MDRSRLACFGMSQKVVEKSKLSPCVQGKKGKCFISQLVQPPMGVRGKCKSPCSWHLVKVQVLEFTYIIYYYR